jgi:Ca2+-binding RTX toxin-like protein
MNNDIAVALTELAGVLSKAALAIADNPEATGESLIALIGAIEAAVDAYDQNLYEDNYQEVVRGLVDLAWAELGATVLVVGGTVLLAPGTGVVVVALSTWAVGEALTAWMGSNRFSFVPSVQDASAALDAVTLYGYAPTSDTLISSAFDDTVFGFSGDDYIVNIGGSDQIFGGLGADRLDYSARSSGISLFFNAVTALYAVTHDSGQDLIDGIDEIIGTSHNDTFVSGGTLNAPAFNGNIVAGSGDDTFLVSSHISRVIVDGGSGSDTLQLDPGYTGSVTIAMNSAPSGLATFSSGGEVFFEGCETIITTAGADAVQGNFEDTFFDLYNGNDSIDAGGGNDSIVAGDGDDVVDGGLGNDFIAGDSGVDSLSGGGGDDFLFFDAADAVVNGGAGRDVGFVTGDAGVTANLAAIDLECVIGGGGSDHFVLNSTDTLMAAGGGGNDTFEVSYGSDTCIIWGGAGADQIVYTGAYAGSLGIMIANVDGLTTENFHLFDKSMLGLGSLDWSQIDVLVLNPDSGDRIAIGDSSHDLAVGYRSVSISTSIWNGGDWEDPASHDVFEFTPSPFLTDDVTSDPGQLDEYARWNQVGYHSQSFLDGYAGPVFTTAQEIVGALWITEYEDPWKSYVRPEYYAEYIDDEWVVTDPLAQGRGFFGDGWDFEIDTEYDLSGAKYVTDWVEQGDGYRERAHYFELESHAHITEPGGWFFVGGGLSGSQIEGGGISANLTGLADDRISDWLLAA